MLTLSILFGCLVLFNIITFIIIVYLLFELDNHLITFLNEYRRDKDMYFPNFFSVARCKFDKQNKLD